MLKALFLVFLLFFVVSAEREGFEPPVPLSTTVFKTAAIDHSATSPKSIKYYIIFWRLRRLAFHKNDYTVSSVGDRRSVAQDAKNLCVPLRKGNNFLGCFCKLFKLFTNKDENRWSYKNFANESGGLANKKEKCWIFCLKVRKCACIAKTQCPTAGHTSVQLSDTGVSSCRRFLFVLALRIIAKIKWKRRQFFYWNRPKSRKGCHGLGRPWKNWGTSKTDFPLTATLLLWYHYWHKKTGLTPFFGVQFL